MRIVAFAGPKTAGKDTAAGYLLARNSLMHKPLFVRVNFADTLKGALALIFGLSDSEINDTRLKEQVLERWPNKTPRELMQNVANLFRTMYAPDIWVRAWRRRIINMQAGCIIVTDLRHIEELELLQELGAIIFYVYNPKVEAERAAAIAANDPLWSDSSEAFVEVLKKAAHATINNDGHNLQNLYSEVHKVFTEHVGDWKDWTEIAEMNGGVRI